MSSPASVRRIEVAAGLVFRSGRLLVAQRFADDSLGGLWEFPGGKRHPEETFEVCLVRELMEELGIEVEVGPLFETINHRYPDLEVHLRFFRCAWKRHEPRALGCAAFAWVTPKELRQYAFPPADRGLLDRLGTEHEAWVV